MGESVWDCDEFLDLPVTTRLLYFDFLVRSDELQNGRDIVYSPKKIMRMTGATEDDLNALIRECIVELDGEGHVLL